MQQASLFPDCDSNITRTTNYSNLCVDGTGFHQNSSSPLRQREEIFLPIFIIIVCSSIASNVTVLVAWLQSRIRRRIIYLYTSNLASADLLMTVTIALNPLIRTMAGTTGTGACKISFFASYTGFTASILTLVAIGLMRYKAVKSSAATTNQQITQLPEKNLARKRCCFIWLIATIISSPLLNAYSGQNIDGKNQCVISNWPVESIRLYFLLYLVLFFVLPLCVLIFVSCRIYCILRNHTRVNQVNSTISSANETPQNPKCEKILFATVVVFFICVGPLSIAKAIEPSFEISSKVPPVYVKLIQFLVLLNPAIDPLIYWAFSSEIRRGCKKTLKNLWKEIIARCSTTAIKL